MNKKTIIVGVCVIILLAVGVGIWAWKENEVKKQEILNIQQEELEKQEETEKAEFSEVDTRGWKNYRNEEYGFEVKYPADWKTKKFKSSCLGLGDCATDCNKMPEKCDITGFSFYDENNARLESTAVSVVPENQKKISELNSVKSQWMQGMFSGCYVTTRISIDNNEFLLGSFRPATDLNNIEITQKESSLCERNMLNPVFNEMIKTFTAIN